MEKIIEVIKIFFEKHLIPTVFSFLTAAIIYAFTPENFWLIEKLTKSGYFFFLSGVVFIFIQLLIWIKTKISEKRYLNSLRKNNAEYVRKENEEAFEKLWDFVDNLCEEDRNYIRIFLKNNNEPVVFRANHFYSYERLFNSQYVKKQEGYDEEGYYVKYILNPDLYHDLKLSAELYGRIGHFEVV